jgi:hypothetical protein
MLQWRSYPPLASACGHALPSQRLDGTVEDVALSVTSTSSTSSTHSSPVVAIAFQPTALDVASGQRSATALRNGVRGRTESWHQDRPAQSPYIAGWKSRPNNPGDKPKAVAPLASLVIDKDSSMKLDTQGSSRSLENGRQMDLSAKRRRLNTDHFGTAERPIETDLRTVELPAFATQRPAMHEAEPQPQVQPLLHEVNGALKNIWESTSKYDHAPQGRICELARFYPNHAQFESCSNDSCTQRA